MRKENSFIMPLHNHKTFLDFACNTNGGDLSYDDDYIGVYVFMEKIKRDKNRVDDFTNPPFIIFYLSKTFGSVLSVYKNQCARTKLAHSAIFWYSPDSLPVL